MFKMNFLEEAESKTMFFIGQL